MLEFSPNFLDELEISERGQQNKLLFFPLETTGVICFSISSINVLHWNRFFFSGPEKSRRQKRLSASFRKKNSFYSIPHESFFSYSPYFALPSFSELLRIKSTKKNWNEPSIHSINMDRISFNKIAAFKITFTRNNVGQAKVAYQCLRFSTLLLLLCVVDRFHCCCCHYY